MNEVRLEGTVFRAYVGNTKGRDWAFATIMVEGEPDRNGEMKSRFISLRINGPQATMLKDVTKETKTKIRVSGSINSAGKRVKGGKDIVTDQEGNKVYDVFVEVSKLEIISSTGLPTQETPNLTSTTKAPF